MDGTIDGRWYAGLVAPVRPQVMAALRGVAGEGVDPLAVPRAGLGGAVVAHVAHGFGSRRWATAARLGMLALESYNQRVYRAAPTSAARTIWLERDVASLRRVWRGLVKRDELLLHRVVDRMIGARVAPVVGDDAIPEGVLFLRAAVAAGVLAGNVPDGVHAVLDRYVSCVALAWEASQRTLTRSGWEGAMRAVGLDAPYTTDAAGTATRLARDVLATLPASPVVELLGALLDQPPSEAACARDPIAWTPCDAPAPLPRPRSGTVIEVSDTAITLDDFHVRWRDAIEGALGTMVATRSRVLQRAVDYLQHQGGKRVRPLVVLAAAVAAGGEARWALPEAAAIEWLHQASLVLDDVVDESTLRRDGPTLHHATTVPFALGVAAYLLARLNGALRDLPPSSREYLVTAATALMDGQRDELRHTGDVRLSVSGYYRIIDAKTARLFACAASLGGLSAGAPAGHIRALARFGREAGLAFQIVDDLLDYVGDEHELGKRPGTDLRACKITLPVIELRAALRGEERARLESLLRPISETHARLVATDEDVRWIRDALVARQLDRACADRARRHLGRARAALASLPGTDGRALLEALAVKFVERRR